MARCPFRFLYQPAPKPAQPLAVMLREQTVDAHKRAEHHPMQQALVRGRVSRGEFVRLACEMRHVHAAGRAAVGALAGHEATRKLAELVVDRGPIFDRDLAALEVRPKDAKVTGPTPATEKLSAWISERVAGGRVAELVGLVYVLEGITNSGYYISKAVERSLKLRPGVGTGWLNPHGDAVQARWDEAREVLNGIGFTAAEAEAAVGGARDTFAMIEGIFGELRGG